MKQIIKKFISPLIAASVLLTAASTVQAHFEDVAEDSFYKDSIDLLADCGIISGTGGGSFNPYGLITRAEMAKIAVVIADVPELPGNSFFSDVSPSYWANGYINAAAKEGILTGYIGGYYAPQNNLTYAEAITVTLRLLGYNGTNLTGAYPDAYLRKASEFGLTDGLNFDPYSPINRQNAAYIIANAYVSNHADGGKLLEKMDYTLSDECVILCDYQNSDDEILTSAGTYLYSGDKENYIGSKARLITDKDNRLVGIKTVGSDVKRSVIAGIAGNDVTVVDSGSVQTMNIPNSALIYYEGSSSTFGAVKNNLSAGDLLYYTQSKTGGFGYGAADSGTSVQAVSAKDADLSGLTLMRNGAVCVSADSMDTAYIYPEEKTAVLYNSKTSGVLQSASPSKENADAVTVSGITYNLSAAASSQVKNLSSGDTVTLIIGRNNEAAAVYRASDTGMVYGIESVTGNEISCWSANGSKVLNLSNTSRVIYDGKDTTFGAVKSLLNGNLQITVYNDDSGRYDYSIIEECELSMPVIASADGENPYNGAENVIRDGKRSTAAAIRKNDVLYYSSALDTVYAYCDSVLGVYEEAYPNQQNPSSIKLSGKIYNIETSAAARTLSNTDYDKYITVLLGKDGEIAGISANAGAATEASTYGVVLSSGRKTVDGVTDYYLTCLNADGTTTDYKTKTDRSTLVGSAVRYAFNDAYFSPSTLKNTSVSGTVDTLKRKIGNVYLSEDCKIIDITYVPDDKNKQALAFTVGFSDISRTELSQGDIKAAIKDSNGEIVFLALNNITYANHKFGIVTKSDGSNAAGYQINIDGTDKTYSSAINLRVSSSQPVAVQIVGNKIVSIIALTKAIGSSELISVNSQRIVTSRETCDLGKNAVFYVYTNVNKYKMITVDDIDDYNISTVSVYTDTAVSRGGVGRVVVLNEKR